MFKNRKQINDQNKTKPRLRKRRIFTTIALVLSLLFGKPRLSSYHSQSRSSNFYNQTIQERVINEQDVNLFENNDQQVILVTTISESSSRSKWFKASES